ncbi:MAG: ATP-binding cassette domain-containing protein [Alphaproteobacteria bacterium]|nr:ATP-binding cassette domain-containing protein [Alphaproteobacteria bacterium]
MSAAILAVEDIAVRFGGVVAVDGVSFSVAPGELVGLIGPNGAGKTTVMRAIVGIVEPQAGSIRLAGAPLDGLPVEARVRRGLALSQQLVRPFRMASVLDNVVLAAGGAVTARPWRALITRDATAMSARARAALDRVGIAVHADKSPATLPLGVLKRLEMARALVLEPRLLLLDEPLAGLNSREAHALAATIAEINAAGVTTVLIEHNLTQVMRVCRRLVVLDNGRKIADGDPRAVMAEPAVRAAYLGH